LPRGVQSQVLFESSLLLDEQGKDRAEHAVPSEGRQLKITVITMEEIPLRVVYTALIHAQQPDQSIFLEDPGSGTTRGNVAERNYTVS
jgi:hypothetical protein